MGDSAIWTGGFVFSPHLRWVEYRELLDSRGKNELLNVVESDFEPENTPDGVLIRRQAIGLSAGTPGTPWGKVSYLADAMEPWLKLVSDLGYQIEGALYTDGDLAPTRHWVETDRSGRVPARLRLCHEIGLIVWPDGTSAYTKAPDGFYRLGKGEPVFDQPARKGFQPEWNER